MNYGVISWQSESTVFFSLKSRLKNIRLKVASTRCIIVSTKFVLIYAMTPLHTDHIVWLLCTYAKINADIPIFKKMY